MEKIEEPKEAKEFNERIDDKMKDILLWWNKLDFTDRELILIKAYLEWNIIKKNEDGKNEKSK